MTLDEAAAFLRVAKITLRRWTRNGELPCVRIGRRGDRRFRLKDLEACLRFNSGPSDLDSPPKRLRVKAINKRARRVL